ncbi:MAG: UvrD-helicase domain-containing protein [Thermodesulfobacterium sp.]|jgi:ATP-dependent exoDNAse (exonuclease V) beta subunit|nr:UvrD-helicase domain-containing protein [Thermodesulfobacterium sp.]
MVYLLSASAGSGKTYTLALNYLKELAKRLNLKSTQGEGYPPLLSSILVLTFTNKASFEMKERILTFLEEIALSTDKGEALSRETGLSPEMAQELLNHLFLYYHKLQVSTIDSYLYRLFRGLAYELELPSQLSVEKNLSEEFLEMALLNFYSRAKDNEKLFSLLLELINFILKEEEKGTINLKSRLIKSLKNYIEQQVRGEEVELNSSSEDIPDKLPYKRAFLYYNLLQELKQDLERILLSHRKVYMGFWKEKLKRYLSDEGLLPWIYFKLGRVECLIKDESQDTDVLHYHNLSPIFENLLAEGHPIYLAWDPKQSIYRWRGADPDYLFSWKASLVEKGYKVYEQKLDKNYRSCKNIVKFNNALFFPLKTDRVVNLIFPLLKAYSGLEPKDKKDKPPKEVEEFFYSSFAPLFCEKLKEMFKDLEQTCENNYNGKVVIYYLKVEGSRSLPKEKIHEVIKGFLEEVKAKDKASEKQSDTAVLLFKNDALSELYQFLWVEGYNLTSKEVAKLNKSPFVHGLLGYLELLLDENNKLALAKVLANIFSEMGREILVNYARLKSLHKSSLGDSETKAEESTPTLWDYLKSSHPEFFEKNILKPLQKGKLLTPYDFLQHLWKSLSLSKKFPDEKPFFYTLLSLILSKQKEGYSLQSLLSLLIEEVEGRSPSLPEKAEVTLMTIHTAKGLEFDNVISVLDYPKQTGGGGESFPLRLQTERGLYYGKKSELSDLSEWKAYLEERTKEFIEMVNLMYVTFTRAKRNLFVIVPVKMEKGRLVGVSYSAKLFCELRKLIPIEDLPFIEERGEVALS